MNKTMVLASVAMVGGILILSACGVNVSQPSKLTAQLAVDKLVYAQDSRTGLCFAAVSVFPVGHMNDASMTITWVPCEPKVLAQLEMR